MPGDRPAPGQHRHPVGPAGDQRVGVGAVGDDEVGPGALAEPVVRPVPHQAGGNCGDQAMREPQLVAPQMPGEERPARNLEHVARAGGHEGILDVVGGGGERHARAREVGDPGQTAGRQDAGVAALQVEVGRGQDDDGHVPREEAVANPLVGRRRQRREQRAMAEDRAPLHPLALHPVERGTEQRAGRVQVFVEVQVDRLAVPHRRLEQQVEAARRILAYRRGAADGVADRHRGIDVRGEPVEVLARMRRHEGHESHRHAVAPAFAKLGRRLEVTKARVLVDIDVAADRRRHPRQVASEGAGGPAGDVVGGRGADVSR